jgi:YbbR domain-containing protein
VQIIRKNFGLKVLSLALAITGWAYFRYAQNPAFAHFDQQISVPITAANLPVGYVAHYMDKEAVVTVATQRGAAPVKPDDIKAVLDLAYKGPGVYNVPVQLVAPSIQVQSLSPASVSLTIERLEQHSYPLTVHYLGAQSQIVVSNAETTPSVVIVRGATSALAEVTAVRIDVPFAQAPGTLDSMVRAVPVDSLGREVSDLQVSPDLVRVQAQFVKGTGPKTP